MELKSNLKYGTNLRVIRDSKRAISIRLRASTYLHLLLVDLRIFS